MEIITEPPRESADIPQDLDPGSIGIRAVKGRHMHLQPMFGVFNQPFTDKGWCPRNPLSFLPRLLSVPSFLDTAGKHPVVLELYHLGQGMAPLEVKRLPRFLKRMATPLFMLPSIAPIPRASSPTSWRRSRQSMGPSSSARR